MINKIVSFLIIILLGFILKRIKFFTEKDGELLKKIIFNISLPALIFISLTSSKFEGKFFLLFIMVPLAMIIQFFLLFITGLLLTKDKKMRASIILSGVMGNTAFLGYPLIEHVLGNTFLPYGILFDQINFYFFLIFLLPVLAHIGGGDRGEIKKFFISPPFFAFIIGLILRNFTIPSLIMEPLILLKYTISPLVMLYLGINLELNIKPKEIKYLLPVSVFKLLIFPFIILLVSSVLRLESFILKPSLLQGMMPTMMASTIFGAEIGLDKKLLTKGVTLTTLLSPLTLTLLSNILL